MNRYLSIIILTSILASGVSVPLARAQTTTTQKANAPKFRPSQKAWKWADKQLKKMSVEEKVGQLIHIGINAKFLNQDSAAFKELQRQVVDNHIGGVIFFGAPIYETAIMIDRAQ